MKIESSDFSGDTATLVISGTDPHTINALRRALIVDVPKMAIDKVEIHLGAISDEDGRTYESTTPLFDEIISHRLGLLPIPTDLDMLTYQEECSCGGEGCVNCQIMYSLNKRGPCTVYSKDLDPLGDEKLRIKDGDIPIVKLTEDEGILIYATARLGTGRVHAKWQATQGVGFKPYPIVEIDTKSCDNCTKCVKACPRGVFAGTKKSVKVKDVEKCSLCGACVEVCEEGAIKVDKDITKYIFRFETDGAVNPKVALMYALGSLEALYTEFLEKVEELK